MNFLLSRTATETRERVARQRPRWVLGWLALAAVAEVTGHELGHDSVDVLWIMAFTLLGFATHAAHRREPIPWWGAVVSRLGRWRRATIEQMPRTGIDLRLDPPIPEETPPGLRRLCLGVWLVASALLAALPWLPHMPRELAAHGGYVLYLAWAAAVWGLCMVVVVWGLTLTVATMRDIVYRSRAATAETPRGSARMVSRLTLIVTVILALLLPVWFPLALAALLALTAVAALHLPQVGRLRFVWSASAGEEGYRSCRWSRITALLTLTVLGVLCGLSAASLGSALLGGTEQLIAHPMGTLLGAMATWSGAAVVAGGAVKTLRLVWLSTFRDPAGRHPPRAHVDGVAAEDRDAVETGFAKLGWAAAFGDDPRLRTDVPVAAERVAWALRGEEPDADTVIALERLHAIRQRRILRRGLRRLLRAAARHRFAAGSGWMINPHLWHATRLKRDQSETDAGPEAERADVGILAQYVGPSYAELFPLPVRRHLLEVLRSADVNLLFVEDGVSANRLIRVLGVLYELHDQHRGARRAEERDFSMLSGTRVCIHEVRLDDPFRHPDYPEPDYQLIGRARVLHVFRDRGGDKVHDETPAPGERVPMLV